MAHERYPLGSDQLAKACLCWCCTPVQMVPYWLYPFTKDRTSLFLSCLQNVFCDGFGNMPNVIEAKVAQMTCPFAQCSVAVVCSWRPKFCTCHPFPFPFSVSQHLPHFFFSPWFVSYSVFSFYFAHSFSVFCLAGLHCWERRSFSIRDQSKWCFLSASEGWKLPS